MGSVPENAHRSWDAEQNATEPLPRHQSGSLPDRPFAPNVPEANGKSTRCVLSGALLPECFGVAPTLVQHQVRDLALLVLEELNFCVDNFWKKHRLRLSKNRDLGLSRYLRYQLVAFYGHHEDKARP